MAFNIIGDHQYASPFLTSIIFLLTLLFMEFVRGKVEPDTSFVNTKLYRYSIYFCYFIVIILMAFAYDLFILLAIYIAFEGVKWAIQAMKKSKK